MRTLERAEKEVCDETAAGAAAKTATEETMAGAAISSATIWCCVLRGMDRLIERGRERESVKDMALDSYEVARPCGGAARTVGGQEVKVLGAALIWISWLSAFG